MHHTVREDHARRWTAQPGLRFSMNQQVFADGASVRKTGASLESR
jgi:hypothetical protein